MGKTSCTAFCHKLGSEVLVLKLSSLITVSKQRSIFQKLDDPVHLARFMLNLHYSRDLFNAWAL